MRQNRLAAVLAASIVVLGIVMVGPAVNADEAKPSASDTPVWRHFPAPPKAPEGAPNILLILTDDVGFGAARTFGGPIPTPALDRIARNGLRYNEFHTTAMCSPTRAALLTGRNHHSVGYGSINNVAIDAPGYTSVIPKSAATIARVLLDHGYDTAMFGKNHNTPEWELGPLGPFDRWPNGMGFNYFYGFNAAMTDQRSPELIENRNVVQPSNDPDYYLDKDLADRLLYWLRVQRAIHGRHPFFVYLAPGTMHEPQQAPPQWIAKFKGKFDKGWDAIREETFKRQKAMGVIPENAVLTPRPPYIPAWDSLPPSTQKLYARMMEVGAAQLAYMDDQFGRILDELERTGELSNTLIIYSQGDNGASEEYEYGNTNYLLYLTDIVETPESMAAKYDKIGSADYNGQYPGGWAWAMNAPFPESKQVASHLGGLRAGLVVSWPDRIKEHGVIRRQFAHVIDIAPTIYDAVGIKPPEKVDGVAQMPLEGVSMIATFGDADATPVSRGQYFEMLGNRAFYQDGWMASTLPPVPPWTRDTSKIDPLSFQWALFDLRTDYSQSKDLSAKYPEKLKALQAKFDDAATAHNVYPLSSNLIGRFDPKFRPTGLDRATSYSFPAGDTRYPMSTFPAVLPGWSGTAWLDCRSDGSSGPIFSSGSRFTGARFWLDKGVPKFLYDPTGRKEERVLLQSPFSLEAGEHTVTVHFARGKKQAMLSLTVDGKRVASADVPKVYNIFGQSFIGRPQIDDATAVRENQCDIQEFAVVVSP